uniref:PARP catalytic domain-containing protein n=1 Tax=Leptobrachium leishanense TaxID=445787 RepID=A0A8C5MUW1_9ANUR
MGDGENTWSEETLPGFHKRCLSSDAPPLDGKLYTMYHGTNLQAAQKIIKHGFIPSQDGMLGRGVYVSRDAEKAACYPLADEDKSNQVIFELRVNVGKVKKIDYQGHPLQKTWHDHGYDTAWVPPGHGMVKKMLEEDCVWDPNRIKVIIIIKAPVNYLARLQNLITCHAPSFGKSQLQSNEEPKEGKFYTMYHGTTLDAAEKVIEQGFQPSLKGMLGKGIYVSRDEEKAARYPLKEDDKCFQVILELKVNVGKVKKIDYQGHPLQMTWHEHGYDTAWVPPGCGMVKSGLEEDCVWDPNRIKVIGVVKAPGNSLVRLQNLLEHRLPASCKTCLQHNKDLTKKNCYIMYHGTTAKDAEGIITYGFQSSPDGILGKGVYISRYESKATQRLQDENPYQVILELSVNVGRVKVIDSQFHPLQKTWYKDFDTAWVSADSGMVQSGLNDCCVRNPTRIKVIGIVKAPETSLDHLQKLIDLRIQGFCKTCLQSKKGRKNQTYSLMYHGATLKNAPNIISYSLHLSREGVFGKGVYVFKHEESATSQPLNLDEDERYQVIFEVRVNLGKIKEIDYEGHPMQTTWYKQYDTAWMPAECDMNESGFDEYCVRDPNRIKVIGIAKAPDPKALLQQLVKNQSIFIY